MTKKNFISKLCELCAKQTTLLNKFLSIGDMTAEEMAKAGKSLAKETVDIRIRTEEINEFLLELKKEKK